jgi:cold shock CspA family protein
MRTKGKLTTWNDEKGFGFITPGTGGKQVFIHIKAFGNRNRRPEINQFVTYTLSADKQGRPFAIKATLPGDRLPEKTGNKNATLPIIGATIFLA